MQVLYLCYSDDNLFLLAHTDISQAEVKRQIPSLSAAVGKGMTVR